ncbi:hypothetical protein LMG18096_02474 [Ralstonia holmesii]|uniref:Uncharacterized protein n=1 Tax=Ralstonia holmesii TaxID=3058602 RepID=A0ABC8QBZ1_9RALS|nr:hypothetical protein LMG18096_02474 [Ralstonia sp. LMG 32967]CAJ0816882.1 hypothetical protein LMG18093_03167 [Ralstonia sp. LMG 32967]
MGSSDNASLRPTKNPPTGGFFFGCGLMISL